MKSRIKTIRYFEFMCPGCGHFHTVPIEGTGNDWKLIGDENNPTLEPSVLNYIPEEKSETGEVLKPRREVCHLFIRAGNIEFCTDSQHELAGKTVPMKEIN